MTQDNTSKRIAEILYEFINQFKDDGYLAQGNTDQAKSLIMELVNEARIDEVKRPISEYQQAELEDKGRGYNFYFALRNRLDQLQKGKA